MDREQALEKARKVCFQKMMKGEIPYFNFHYKRLWSIFSESNWEAIEKAESKVMLIDFLLCNQFESRVAMEDGYSSLVRNVLYCVLTILKRVGKNYIFELDKQANFFPSIFNFSLQNEDIKIDKEWDIWVSFKICTDPSLRAEFLGSENS